MVEGKKDCRNGDDYGRAPGQSNIVYFSIPKPVALTDTETSLIR